MQLIKKNIIINIIKILLFIGQNTIFGRGKFRKILIFFLNVLLLNSKLKKNKLSCFVCKINSTPFYFYPDQKIGPKVWFGRNENYEIKFAKSLLSDDFVFFDIGANFGLYTMNIAKLMHNFPNSKIISIEPNNLSYKRLIKNLSLLLKKNNKIFTQVKTEKSAIGNKNLTTKLYHDHDYAVSSLIKSKNKQKYSTVNSKKLLDIIKKHNIKNITLIKIDIEGFEDRALLNFFQNSKKSLYPSYVIIEHSNKKNWKMDIIKYIISKGYKKIWNNHNNSILEFKKIASN